MKKLVSAVACAWVLAAVLTVAKTPPAPTSWGCWWEDGQVVCDWIDS